MGLRDEPIWSMVDPAIWQGLDYYVNAHIATGGFLTALLEGDLYGAVRRADRQNYTLMGPIADWIFLHLPHEAYGSPAKVEAWLARRSTCEEVHVARAYFPPNYPKEG